MMADVSGKHLKVICVDDESALLEIMKTSIEGLGFDVVTASDGDEALALVQSLGSRVALVVSDQVMPNKSGTDLRREMLTMKDQIPFVMISGQVAKDSVIGSADLKINSFLAKPFHLGDLLTTVSAESRLRVASILEDDELREGFLVDARSLVDEMETLVMGLEENPDSRPDLDRIYTCAHTIKGTSGFFTPKTVHTFMHHFEDYLSLLKKDPSLIGPSSSQVLLNALDVLKGLLGDLETQREPDRTWDGFTEVFRPAAAPTAPTAPSTPPAKASAAAAPSKASGPAPGRKDVSEIRVGTEILDRFIEKSGEITVLRNMIDKVFRSLEANYREDRAFSSLSGLMNDLYKSVSGMQEQVADLKKVPASQIVKPLFRSLRDLTQSLGKQIRLDVAGADLRIDISLAEHLNNLLIHLVRNSADHGIESPADRRAAGKAEGGSISISFLETNDHLVVEIGDDGRGLDPERIRASAVKKGVITQAQADGLDAHRSRMLIFEAGFSTADAVTDISGRGVGTAMAKQVVEKLGGTLDLASEKGLGTTFTLKLPLPKSVLIITSLLARLGTDGYAISQDQIDYVLDLSSEAVRAGIKEVGGSYVFASDSAIVPIVSLTELTKEPAACMSFTEGFMIRVLSRCGPYFIVVDEILGIEDIVVKPLSAWANRDRYYAGATFFADGRVGLILDVHEIALKRGLLPNAKVTAKADEPSVADEAPISLVTFTLGRRSSYAIRRSLLSRFERLSQNQIHRESGRVFTLFRQAVLPLIDLRSTLEIPAEPASDSNFESDITVMIVETSEHRHVGYVVDEINELIEVAHLPEAQVFANGHQVEVIGGRTLTIIDPDEIEARSELSERTMAKAS